MATTIDYGKLNTFTDYVIRHYRSEPVLDLREICNSKPNDTIPWIPCTKVDLKTKVADWEDPTRLNKFNSEGSSVITEITFQSFHDEISKMFFRNPFKRNKILAFLRRCLYNNAFSYLTFVVPVELQHLLQGYGFDADGVWKENKFGFDVLNKRYADQTARQCLITFDPMKRNSEDKVDYNFTVIYKSCIKEWFDHLDNKKTNSAMCFQFAFPDIQTKQYEKSIESKPVNWSSYSQFESVASYPISPKEWTNSTQEFPVFTLDYSKDPDFVKMKYTKEQKEEIHADIVDHDGLAEIYLHSAEVDDFDTVPPVDESSNAESSNERRKSQRIKNTPKKVAPVPKTPSPTKLKRKTTSSPIIQLYSNPPLSTSGQKRRGRPSKSSLNAINEENNSTNAIDLPLAMDTSDGMDISDGTQKPNSMDTSDSMDLDGTNNQTEEDQLQMQFENTHLDDPSVISERETLNNLKHYNPESKSSTHDQLKLLKQLPQVTKFESKSTITLPATFTTTWIHRDYHECQAWIDVFYIDTQSGNPVQPKMNGEDLEFFRYAQDQDGNVFENEPLRRICVFHVIRAIYPPFLPLQFLVGRWFSSVRNSGKFLQLTSSCWDAWTMVGTKIKLRSFLDTKIKPFINHSWLNIPIQFPGTKISSILPRDLFACLSREDCNEFECFEMSDAIKDLTPDTLEDIKNEIEKEDEKRVIDPETRAKHSKIRAKMNKQMMNMTNRSVCDMVCKHKIRHNLSKEDYEQSLRGFSRVNDTDKEDVELSHISPFRKKRGNRVGVLSNSHQKSKPTDSSKSLDNDWGKRLTYLQLSSEEVKFIVKHPFWFKKLFELLNKDLKLCSKELSSWILPTIDYQFQPLFTPGYIQTEEHWEFIKRYYDMFDVLNVSWFSSKQSLKSAWNSYASMDVYERVGNPNSFDIPLQLIPTDKDLYYLVSLRLKNSNHCTLLHRIDAGYSNFLHVPISREFMLQHIPEFRKPTEPTKLDWTVNYMKFEAYEFWKKLDQWMKNNYNKDVQTKNGRLVKGYETEEYGRRLTQRRMYKEKTLFGEELIFDSCYSRFQLAEKEKQEMEIVKKKK